MSTWRILLGDVRETLASLPAASVQCCVTSPPYWGLRDYGHDGQLGLEPTPDAYVANMVQVFRDVRRVLRDDGTLWLNLGDSYQTTSGGGQQVAQSNTGAGLAANRHPASVTGLKPKDLVGIPWRVAFALQADGWYLRSDIIWSKPNPMPESVTDRPTKAHEYLFLLTKSARYYYDAEAIKEPLSPLTIQDREGRIDGSIKGYRDFDKYDRDTGPTTGRRAPCGESGNTRNKRSVWHVATQPYAEAHFATYPEALITPCVLAGTSEQGQCPACGAPWVRVVEHVAGDAETGSRPKQTAGMGSRTSTLSLSGNGSKEWAERGGKTFTAGWQPSCACAAGDPVPQIVLDPFTGSGTTGAVAVRHQRSFVGCELNPEYLALARKRIGAVAPLLAQEVA